MRLNWKNDDDAVATVNRLGIKWSYATVQESMIDEKRSKHNHARKTPIVQHNVDDYAESMDRGDVFPQIVVARIDGENKYVIAGGNHRYQAAKKLGVTEFDTILVECDATMFSILCPALNLYVGQREDRSVRIEQAAEAVMRLGITAKSAAEDYRVPVSSVCHCINEKKVVVAAAKLGLRADKLSSGYLRVLAPIMTDAALLPLAVELCNTKLGIEDVRTSLKMARELPLEKDRVEKMQEVISNAKKVTVSGRVTRQPVRSLLMRSVTMIQKTVMKEGCSLCYLQITKQEAMSMAAELETVANRLKNVGVKN
jgi:uncharacterized ParB-like nuclease family protein